MPYQPQDVAQAYNAKYTGHGFRNSDYYYQWALDTLAPRPGESLLDIACGMGDLLYYATQRQLRCYGIDLSPVAVQLAREKAPQAQISEANAEALPFSDGMFDNVTILGSLEHLLDPGKGLLEMRRVLGAGGRLLVLVPNSYYLPDIIYHVWRRGYGPNHKQIVERFAAVQEWRAFIESAGFRVRRIRRYNYQRPRSREDWAWYRENPRRLLYLLASPFIPFNLSHSFLYLCEKVPDQEGRTFQPPFWPAPPRLVDLG